MPPDDQTDPPIASNDGGNLAKPIPGESACVIWAASWFFFVLLSYSMVRPVRETMGAIVGTTQLQYLMAATFVVMLFAVPAYSALVARLSRRWLVRVVFHFFCVCLLTFAVSLQSENELVQKWTARALFVWVNLFALFATSVFWSVLADLFSSGQGKRLFGRVAAGGTAGAIAGSLLTSQVASWLSTAALLLLPIVTLQMGLWCAWRLEKNAAIYRQNSPETSRERPQRTSGGLMTGVTRVVTSPYLASICLFLFFVQAFGTQLYFQQAEIVAAEIPNKAAKTQLFAYLDLGTQVLTLLVQAGLSATVLRRFGVSIALIILPVVYAIGLTALSVMPSLPVLIIAMIAARATGYGITVPAREVLFTVVDREDKYKSKSFIDTVVLRGGDALSGQLFGTLRNSFGVAASSLNVWALPFIGFWAWSAYRLGQRQRKKAESMAKPS